MNDFTGIVENLATQRKIATSRGDVERVVPSYHEQILTFTYCDAFEANLVISEVNDNALTSFVGGKGAQVIRRKLPYPIRRSRKTSTPYGDCVAILVSHNEVLSSKLLANVDPAREWYVHSWNIRGRRSTREKEEGTRENYPKGSGTHSVILRSSPWLFLT
jgi:hypothetical protein